MTNSHTLFSTDKTENGVANGALRDLGRKDGLKNKVEICTFLITQSLCPSTSAPLAMHVLTSSSLPLLAAPHISFVAAA